MSPPQEAATGSRLTSVPAESHQDPTAGLGLPHTDPTFLTVARRLDWGTNDWTLRGPSFEDGTYPIFHIEWRLGEILMKLLGQYSRVTLSRRQEKTIEKGEPLERIRLVKKNTPTAVEFDDMNSSRGSTENTII